MDEKIAVNIRHLTKIYKGSTEPAVDDLNLQIYKGEFYGLLGPNGAGKTTTISIISSLIKPTKGEVFIDGYDLMKDLPAIKRIIGVVPQEIALYEKLTAFENLYYFGRLYGINKSDLHRRIDFLLERLGLVKYKFTKLINCSGGIKRRINLIAGMIHLPKILILDEPVVGIDVQSRNLIKEFLKELNKDNTTIIYTSHIMEDAEKLCSRLSILDYGKLVEQGAPNELINKNSDCSSLEDVFLKLTGQSLRD
ncbi:MAG: ABC transporter ATP-binding protein [Draconibacterium sp.]|nr:ABC transporter ATP-binding protein [Draconibacterium sp.]